MPEFPLLPPLLAALLLAGCTAPNDLFDLPDGRDAAGGAQDATPFDTSVPTDASAPADAVAQTDGPVEPDGAAPPPDAPLPLDTGSATDVGPPPDVTAPTPDAPAAGLVGLWTFDEGTGSRVADASGRANHGTITGPVNLTTAWQTGEQGGALEIPDLNETFVSIPASSSIDAIRTGFTIAAWVNRKADRGSRNAAILSRQSGDRNDDVYTLAFVNNSLVLWMQLASLKATQTAPLNTWIHVAATWDGSVMRLYQDGVLAASGGYTNPLPTTTNPVLLGNNVNQMGANQPLAGVLDEARLYDRALSAAEILTLARR